MFFHLLVIPRVMAIFSFAAVAQIFLSKFKKKWCGWILPIVFGIASAYLIYRELNFALMNPDYYAVAVLVAAPIMLLLLFYVVYFRRQVK